MLSKENMLVSIRSHDSQAICKCWRPTMILSEQDKRQKTRFFNNYSKREQLDHNLVSYQYKYWRNPFGVQENVSSVRTTSRCQRVILILNQEQWERCSTTSILSNKYIIVYYHFIWQDTTLTRLRWSFSEVLEMSILQNIRKNLSSDSMMLATLFQNS